LTKYGILDVCTTFAENTAVLAMVSGPAIAWRKL
jgi:hypothetical protein